MKTTIKTLLCVAMAGAVLASCTGKKDDKKGGMKEELPLVKVETVADGTVDAVSEYTATVEAFKTNNISSMTGNRIKRILVDVGSHVRAGQSLVILDDVSIDQQRMAIDQQRIALANQRRDLERAKELVKIGGGTQQTVDQLQAQYDAQARAIDASNRSLRNMQENTVLTAPVSGIVTAKNYDAGDLPGAMPILTIEQQQPLKVVVSVNETEYPMIKVGMPVDVKFDTYGEEVFAGRVSIIHPTIDPNTRTFSVEVTIANSGERIRTGMFARVTFNYGSYDSMILPDRAIVKQVGSGVRYVFLYKPENDSVGTVEWREVTIGSRLKDRYEVTDGLTEGMQVVLTGQSRLADGVRAQIQK